MWSGSNISFLLTRRYSHKRIRVKIGRVQTGIRTPPRCQIDQCQTRRCSRLFYSICDSSRLACRTQVSRVLPWQNNQILPFKQSTGSISKELIMSGGNSCQQKLKLSRTPKSVCSPSYEYLVNTILQGGLYPAIAVPPSVLPPTPYRRGQSLPKRYRRGQSPPKSYRGSPLLPKRHRKGYLPPKK